MLMHGDPVGGVVERALHQRPVRDRAMEAFGIILHRILPIGAQRIFAAIGADERGGLRREGGDLGGERSGDRLEIRRRAVEIDEEESEEGAEADGSEVEAPLVEVRQMLGAARAAERAGEVIGPGVVGAGDGGRFQPAFALEQAMGAMLADIEEGPDLAVPVAQQKHALVQYVADDIAARLGDHRDMADILPAAVEDPPPLALEDLRVEIVEARQGARARGIAIEAGDGAGWRSRSLVPPYVKHARA